MIYRKERLDGRLVLRPVSLPSTIIKLVLLLQIPRSHPLIVGATLAMSWRRRHGAVMRWERGVVGIVSSVVGKGEGRGGVANRKINKGTKTKILAKVPLLMVGDTCSSPTLAFPIV